MYIGVAGADPETSDEERIGAVQHSGNDEDRCDTTEKAHNARSSSAMELIAFRHNRHRDKSLQRLVNALSGRWRLRSG